MTTKGLGVFLQRVWSVSTKGLGVAFIIPFDYEISPVVLVQVLVASLSPAARCRGCKFEPNYDRIDRLHHHQRVYMVVHRAMSSGSQHTESSVQVLLSDFSIVLISY